MGDVVSIEGMRPHVVVNAADGAHVIPVSLLEDVAKGARPSEILTEPVIQRIIEEWLESTSR
ncbi:hypothetical protein NJI34_28625 [Pseudomonas sp. S 311-6]|uniref:hypothetical protein n=1 Tax=Pseudomonas TaxID=286 RepID=UPI00209754F7|nr:MULTISPECIES: hypothetical protein [Pseudomonas]MCO7566435.1 hypothetical protein [Pseudomonas mosselii]MCO7617463.1 hypothetical protein [Pseudomonas guariconensis]MCO7640741.1 hypothetical protein [Pseudomonas sp. S 311-6]